MSALDYYHAYSRAFGFVFFGFLHTVKWGERNTIFEGEAKRGKGKKILHDLFFSNAFMEIFVHVYCRT